MDTWLAVPAKDTNPLQNPGRCRYMMMDPTEQMNPSAVKNTAQYQAVLGGWLLDIGYMAMKIPRSCMMEFWMRNQKSMSSHVPTESSRWDQARARKKKV